MTSEKESFSPPLLRGMKILKFSFKKLRLRNLKLLSQMLNNYEEAKPGF